MPITDIVSAALAIVAALLVISALRYKGDGS